MSNLSLLIKTNIINEFNLNKGSQLNKKEKTKFILIALGIVAFLGYLIWQMFEVCFMVSDILIKSNILDLMIIGSFASAILLCLFTTLYKSSSYLFSSKDFDILSSLPLKDSDVLISKIFMLLISNYLFSLPIIFIPGIVYGINTNSSVVYYLYLILMSICVPLIPMVISSIISFGLGKISSKVKYKNIILISGSIILMILYFIVVSKIQDVGIALIENNKSVTESINKIYFITKYFVDALVNLNFISMIKFLGISIGIFALFIKVFAKPFKIINSEMREAHKNKTSKIIKVKSDKVITSLLKKEVVRYFSSYMYVLNSSIGMILLPLFAISIFLLGADRVSQLLNMNTDLNLIGIQIMLVVSFCIITSCTTHCTISLEGKNLWILKSLPIREIDIFKSKIILNLLITIPITIISFILISIRMKFEMVFTLIGILFIISICLLVPVLGLLLNLKYPNLDWKNEITVIKKGLPLMLILVISVVYLFILGFIYLKINIFTIEQFLLGISIMNFVISYVLWNSIKTKGVQLFKSI